MSKRYVLLEADRGLSDADMKTLHSILEGKYGQLKVIAVRDRPRAVIVKTTNSVAPLLRETVGEIRLGDGRLTPVLTSGSIGKLKSRASESETTRDGKVP